MALKNWSKNGFPYMSLNDGSSDFWTVSSVSGTHTYYYNQTNIGDVEPIYVSASGVELTKGSVDSLSALEYAWGDVDSLNRDTLYVRLSDDSDPDVKPNGYVKCSKPYSIMTGSASAEVVILSFIISNFSEHLDSTIWIYHKDSGGDVYFKWVIIINSASSPFVLDSRICLNNSDSIEIQSSINDVCVMISGDETS